MFERFFERYRSDHLIKIKPVRPPWPGKSVRGWMEMMDQYAGGGR